MSSPSQRLRSSRPVRVAGGSRLPWVAGGVLVLLLVLLALLQLRWLGEVAQADRQRVDAGVAAALHGLRLEVDREISRAWLGFRAPQDDRAFTPREVVALWQRWRETAPVPRLVGSLWLVTEAGPAGARRWNGRGWVPPGEAAATPFSAAQWAVIERDLSWGRRWGRGRGGDRSEHRDRSPGGLPFLHAELPGLVVPVDPLGSDGSAALAGSDDAAAPQRGVVVLFDRGYLVGDLLPALAERSLGPVLGGDVRLRVSTRREDGTPGDLIDTATDAATGTATGTATEAVTEARAPNGSARGGALPSGEARSAEPAAAEEPFPWQVPVFGLLPPDELLRLGLSTGALTEELPADGDQGAGRVAASSTGAGADRASAPASEPPSDGDTARRERRMAALASILGGPPGWLLEVRPAGGGLDSALGRARWGNAALSFGILLLLALAAGALAVSARRAQETARRQLEFTASVSHELRTPLAAIRSLAENLADGVVRDGAQARRYGEEINRQGERLSDMVEQVLALSALSANAGGRPRNLRPVDPARLVAEAVAESRAVVPDARVEVDLPASTGGTDTADGAGGLPEIVGDPTALRRALQNLVANALKHGGEPPWAAVRASVDRGEGTLRIGVTDRGPGIPAAERERIFEPFVRGQRAQEGQLPGTGLGLHLVRRTAAGHGGRVEVCSAPGEGSTFTLVLPLRSPFGGGPSGATAAATPGRTHGAGEPLDRAERETHQ